MYWVFGGMAVCLLLLAAPNGHIVLYTPNKTDPEARINIMRFVMNPWLFTFLIFLVGCGMGIGKAAVFKYIPEYFPKDVGAVGGLVGMLGALGGFLLPPTFSSAWAATGVPQTTFAILFAITAASFLWLHWVVLGILRKATPHLDHVFEESGGGKSPQGAQRF